MPQVEGYTVVSDVKTLGAGWDRGVFVGWHAGSWIVADPARCQFVIVIRSAAQAENARTILKQLGERDLCLVDYTNH